MTANARLGRLGLGAAIGIGTTQILALLSSISRSGSTITAELLRASTTTTPPGRLGVQ